MTEQRLVDRETTPQVRGCVITARFAYVASRWGDGHKHQLLSKFGSGDRRRLEGVAADGDWFDIGIFETIEKGIVQEIANNEPGISIALGRACADYNLKRILAVRTSGLGPELVLQRFCKMPVLDNLAEGEYEELEVPSGHGAAITYAYPPSVSPLYVESQTGFFQRLISRLNGTNVAVKCRKAPDHGVNAWRYEITWELGTPEEDLDEPSGAITGEEITGSHDRSAEVAADPLRAVFLDAVSPSGATPVSEKKVIKERRRFEVPRKFRNLKIIVPLALVVFALVILEIAWSMGAFTPAHRGYLGGHTFERSGDLDVVVALEERILLVETGVTLNDVKITAQLGDTFYVMTYPVLPATTLVNADLGSFTSEDGAHPPTSETPSKVVIEAMLDGRKQIAEYRP
jgi:hypothetical protein